MLIRSCGILLFGLTLASAAEAVAQAPATTPVPASADPLQFYVFSFTDTPVTEAAQDIVGGALSYDLQVDPAVDGLVTFRADGWYGSDALLQDFGTALLDQDVALMRTAPGAYALIPRANIPVLLSRGGVLMTLPQPTTARPPAPVAVDVPTPDYGRDRWWDGAIAALLIFFGGALAGGAALFAGQTVYRRAEAQERLSPPQLRLTDQSVPLSRSEDTSAPDPDLVIPRFDRKTQD